MVDAVKSSKSESLLVYWAAIRLEDWALSTAMKPKSFCRSFVVIG